MQYCGVYSGGWRTYSPAKLASRSSVMEADVPRLLVTASERVRRRPRARRTMAAMPDPRLSRLYRWLAEAAPTALDEVVVVASSRPRGSKKGASSCSSSAVPNRADDAEAAGVEVVDTELVQAGLVKNTRTVCVRGPGATFVFEGVCTNTYEGQLAWLLLILVVLGL